MALTVLWAWLSTRSYVGIIHDTPYYALLALARLSPESLGGDVFLAHGSQDQFSLFSPLLAATLDRFGLEPALLGLTLAFNCAALLGADAVDGAVAGHGGQPSQRLAFVRLVQMSLVPKLHQHLLHDILSVMMVVQHVRDRGEQQAGILAIEGLERDRVAFSDTLQQQDVSFDLLLGFKVGRIHHDVGGVSV